MAIFGPTVRPGAVVLFFRPTRRETVNSLMQIGASPLDPRACSTGKITGWQRGGGGEGMGGYLAARRFFFF